jgi:hypothetical protein
MKPINRDALLRTLERCCAQGLRPNEGQGYEESMAVL